MIIDIYGVSDLSLVLIDEDLVELSPGYDIEMGIPPIFILTLFTADPVPATSRHIIS